jgi:hypothetical protein
MKLLVSPSVAFAALLASSAAGAVAPHRALPAETLSGTKLTVPADLPETPVVFVIGFSKASKAQTRAWSRALTQRLAGGEAAVYSVSVIEDVPGFLRGFVAHSIRNSVPGPMHGRFLLVSQQSSAWKDLASCNGADDACLVLMDATRDVAWRTSGPVTEKKLQALTDALESRAAEAVPGASPEPGRDPPTPARGHLIRGS